MGLTANPRQFASVSGSIRSAVRSTEAGAVVQERSYLISIHVVLANRSREPPDVGRPRRASWNIPID